MSKFPEFEPDLGSPPDARSAYALEYIAARLAAIPAFRVPRRRLAPASGPHIGQVLDGTPSPHRNFSLNY